MFTVYSGPLRRTVLLSSQIARHLPAQQDRSVQLDLSVHLASGSSPMHAIGAEVDDCRHAMFLSPLRADRRFKP